MITFSLIPTVRGVFRVEYYDARGVYRLLFPGMMNSAPDTGMMSAAGNSNGADKAVAGNAAGHETLCPWPRLGDDLNRFFQGEAVSFADYPLDRRNLTIFQERVLGATGTIPRGRVITYAGLAELAGYPAAWRAAGKALAANRHLLLVPCHRVVPAAGGIGGYRAGKEWKKELLTLEAKDK